MYIQIYWLLVGIGRSKCNDQTGDYETDGKKADEGDIVVHK